MISENQSYLDKGINCRNEFLPDLISFSRASGPLFGNLIIRPSISFDACVPQGYFDQFQDLIILGFRLGIISVLEIGHIFLTGKGFFHFVFFQTGPRIKLLSILQT